MLTDSSNENLSTYVVHRACRTNVTDCNLRVNLKKLILFVYSLRATNLLTVQIMILDGENTLYLIHVFFDNAYGDTRKQSPSTPLSV